VFPQGAPIGFIDFEVLVMLELSGASIRNAALHAAYLAVLYGRAITMGDIMAGAKNEYAKTYTC